MKITQVSQYTAPANNSMGTQRVLESLSYTLEKMGHEISLLINPDSILPFGTIVNTIPSDTDIVHYQGGWPEEYGKTRDKHKWISTVHGGGQDSPKERQEKRENKNNLVFVSQFIANMCDSKAVIHNCIVEQEMIYSENKENYFLWLGGTDWGEQKGLFSVIDLAKKLHFNLKIVGGGQNQEIIHGIHQEINGCSNIEFLSLLNGVEKAQVLSKAKALFMIGKIADACPLTTIEALACGTPVIARNIASHPEMIGEKAGFLCDSDIDIVKAILNINKINPRDCRNRYDTMFSQEVVAKKYIQYYEHILQHGDLQGIA